MRAAVAGVRRRQCSPGATALPVSRRLHDSAMAALCGRSPSVLVGSAYARRQRHCSQSLTTAPTGTPDSPGAPGGSAAPTLDINLRKLLFMVHPDMFPDGSTEKRVNLEAVKSINSYIDTHKLLIEGDDDAQLPIPGRQPTMIKLYVRQQTEAEAEAVTAILQDTTQAQPHGFEKSMDKLFSLVGLPQLYAQGGTVMMHAFKPGSVGHEAAKSAEALLRAAQRQDRAEKDVGALTGLLMQVHHVRVIFPSMSGNPPVPILAREQLLINLTSLLCEYAATADSTSEHSAHVHNQFEPRPGYVYGMDGTAQYKERSPDAPPIVVYICLTDDGVTRKEVSGAGAGSNPDSNGSVNSDSADHNHQEHDSASQSLTAPANMAWDPASRQVWLGVSRAPQRDASVGGVAGGVEVVHEGWGVAVTVIAAMQAEQPLPPSPYPGWLEIGNAESHELGDPDDRERRAEKEAALATALGLGFVTVDAESVPTGKAGTAAMARYDTWLQDASELALFRKQIAANTVSNMRPVAGHEKVQKQRSALQSVGLLVQVEDVSDEDPETRAAGACAQSTDEQGGRMDSDLEQLCDSEQDDDEPPWLRNRRVQHVDEQSKPANRDNLDTQARVGIDAKHCDDRIQEKVHLKGTGGVSIISVSDTLVLRCSTSCSPDGLWRYVSRGEDGGNEAGAAAEKDQLLAKKALAAIVATRQLLGLASLQCADGVDWEEVLYACERLRGKAKRLRPVLAGVKMELVDNSSNKNKSNVDSGGSVIPDFEVGVLRVDVGARVA
eukprot:COSAG02_NODE_2596_length_8456_cov_23.592078_5_plen_777_part_00